MIAGGGVKPFSRATRRRITQAGRPSHRQVAIDHLVFDRTYSNRKLNTRIEEARSRIEAEEKLVPVSALSKDSKLTYNGKDAEVAIWKRSRKSRINIRFEEQLKVCNQLSLVDDILSGEVLGFYKKRNSVHLSAKLKSAINVELSDTKRGFRRINGFCENVKRGFQKHGEPI